MLGPKVNVDVNRQRQTTQLRIYQGGVLIIVGLRLQL